MLNLTSKLELTEGVINSSNLCNKFSTEDLQRIGVECQQGYQRDVESRRVWAKRNEAGMDLALQIVKDKTFPWPGCSSVAFPLVTTASMQFHARAYPAIINGTEVAGYRVIGEDPTGELRKHANKISTHMSWQLLEEDTAWEEQQDRLLLNLSIVGTTFKKSYYGPTLGHNVSEMVMAKDLVMDYWAKSTDACSRKTHILPMLRNEIHEKILRGTYRDVLEETWYQSVPTPRATTQKINSDNRQGIVPSQSDDSTPLSILEQHCSMDLDGDGYAEPYIITFEEHSACVLRIVTRFDSKDAIERVKGGKYDGKILKINPIEYFTKYSFIPSPDGGMYDVGFGVFLGPLNEAVNSIVNQLIDAGTVANTAGGFLGRGAKIRGGVYQFSPFGWNRVDSTGDDLRKSVFPLPVREPSQVLFSLLSLLIQYTNRVGGTTETTVGENPGQNTPAYNMQSMVEMGQKIYTAIFKRVWRSEKEEFKKLFKLNAKFLPVKGQLANREDYLSSADNVVPAADPNIVSEHIKLQRAVAIREASTQVPGYDREAVERRFLKAMNVEGVAEIYPGVQKTGPLPNPKVQVEQLKLEFKKADLNLKQMQFIAQLKEDMKLNEAKITELMAKAALEMEEAGGVKEGHQIAMFEAALGAIKSHNEHLRATAEMMMKEQESGDNERGMGSMANTPANQAGAGTGT